MKKPAAITLLVIFGNALTVVIGAMIIATIGMVIGFIALAGYVVLSLISAKNFKRKFGFGYRKYFLCGALPAPVLSFLSFEISSRVFNMADAVLWVMTGSAMLFGLVYCLFFGASLLIVWGREEYGK